MVRHWGYSKVSGTVGNVRRRPPHHSDDPAHPDGPGPTGSGAAGRSRDGPEGRPRSSRPRRGGPSAGGAEKRDRRSSRWDEHRRARRDELTLATIAAIREHGPDVGMTQVATLARTSKTVVYRHFADKTDLYLAVCDTVAAVLVAQLQQAMRETSVPQDTLIAGIDAYLRLIESDPEVYRYVMRPPRLDRSDEDGAAADPVADLCSVIGDHISEIISTELRRQDRDAAPATTWGHGIVGLVRQAGDQWLAARPEMDRSVLAGQLADLAWSGLDRTVNHASRSSAS